MPSIGGAPWPCRRQLLLVLVCYCCLLVQKKSASAQYNRFDDIDALDERICGLRKRLADDRGSEPEGLTSDQQESAQTRISAGWDAARGEFPWSVMLRLYFETRGEEYFTLCGGSIIHHNLILTAAHCLDLQSLRPFRITVWAGMIEGTEISRAQSAEAEIYCRTPGWDGFWEQPHRDLALIRLKNSFHYNDDVRPICIRHPMDFEPALYSHCIVSGFGATNDKIQENLWESKLQGLSQEPCPARVSVEVGTDENEVCMLTADMKHHPGSTCSGDSGGGLACLDSSRNDGRYYLAGTLSNGPNICQPGEATVSIYASIWRLRHDLLHLYDQCAS